MAPEDIKITYSETVNNNNNINKIRIENESDPEEPMTSALFEPKTSAVVDANAYNNFEAWNQMYGDEKSMSNEKPDLSPEKPEPPRVLPSTERQDKVDDKIENPQTGKNGSKANKRSLFIKMTRAGTERQIMGAELQKMRALTFRDTS